ncbi:MAG: hypothetical protein KGH72_02420 [Candidatus Micrarchaeota archaeon]|nr:hypothetical protein [Candidatus Micrarchaeota archaeon]
MMERKAAPKVQVPFADYYMRDGKGVGVVRLRIPTKDRNGGLSRRPDGTLFFIMGTVSETSAGRNVLRVEV